MLSGIKIIVVLMLPALALAGTPRVLFGCICRIKFLESNAIILQRAPSVRAIHVVFHSYSYTTDSEENSSKNYFLFNGVDRFSNLRQGDRYETGSRRRYRTSRHRDGFKYRDWFRSV
jgi:hypothetical protein